MSKWHSFGVFFAAAHLGFKEVFAERLVLFGSFLTYATLVVAYSNVFHGIPAKDIAIHNLTASDMIWYFGATELILFCSSFTYFKELQYNIQNEQICLSLLRPCPVWIVLIGEWIGQTSARFLILFLPCVALVGIMAGGSNPSLQSMAGYVLSLPLASLIMLCFYFIIGASCLWFSQADPAALIWQKSLFFFGALLWPLVIYPSFLQILAWISPFPSILAVPAQWTLGNSTTILMSGLFHQLVWVALSLLLASAVNRAMLRRIQKKGI